MSRPPCLNSLGWRLSDQSIWVSFSDSSVYVYYARDIVEFEQIRDASHHGTIYNSLMRADFNGSTKVGSLPDDLDVFVEF